MVNEAVARAVSILQRQQICSVGLITVLFALDMLHIPYPVEFHIPYPVKSILSMESHIPYRMKSTVHLWFCNIAGDSCTPSPEQQLDEPS